MRVCMCVCERERELVFALVSAYANTNTVVCASFISRRLLFGRQLEQKVIVISLSLFSAGFSQIITSKLEVDRAAWASRTQAAQVERTSSMSSGNFLIEPTFFSPQP